jgi:hypothetical protein
MNRRKFLRNSGIIAASTFLSSRIAANSILVKTALLSNKFIEKIISIIREMKNEGSNLVKKVMNEKKYEYDPYTHYPYEGGIKDELTGYQLFFHIHRQNEYGHFHTFAKDENGDLVHLILVSMNKEGEPIGLATVNRWVTGDKYVQADVLKSLSEKYFVDPKLYKDKRVVEFINYVFKGYKLELNQLFEDRDRWIINYVNHNFREPFEDRDYEVLSYKQIVL